MRKTMISFFFLVLIAGLPHCSKPERQPVAPPDEDKKEAVTVKVMTYNTYGARSNNGNPPTDLAAIAQVITRADPDLVALQEIDKGTQRSGTDIDQAKTLSELTGMHYYFVKAIDQQGGEYGDAILSKFPIKDPKAYRLTTTSDLGGELRSVARITVELAGKQFYFVSTHLDHLGNEANRIHQAKALNEILKTFDKPVILAGDLNALPDSKTLDILKLQLTLGCPNNNCQFTFPSDRPNRTIDYILYAPLDAMKVLDYAVYGFANQESDHLPVLARFELKK